MLSAVLQTDREPRRSRRGSAVRTIYDVDPAAPQVHPRMTERISPPPSASGSRRDSLFSTGRARSKTAPSHIDADTVYPEDSISCVGSSSRSRRRRRR